VTRKLKMRAKMETKMKMKMEMKIRGEVRLHRRAAGGMLLPFKPESD